MGTGSQLPISIEICFSETQTREELPRTPIWGSSGSVVFWGLSDFCGSADADEIPSFSPASGRIPPPSPDPEDGMVESPSPSMPPSKVTGGGGGGGGASSTPCTRSVCEGFVSGAKVHGLWRHSPCHTRRLTCRQSQRREERLPENPSGHLTVCIYIKTATRKRYPRAGPRTFEN